MLGEIQYALGTLTFPATLQEILDVSDLVKDILAIAMKKGHEQRTTFLLRIAKKMDIKSMLRQKMILL